jgi:Kef-type K+ transport system membrane component KefB
LIITLLELELFNIILLISLALIFARVFGYLFDRLKQPVVIGEIISGLILGGIVIVLFNGHKYSIFNFSFSLPSLNLHSTEFTLIAELGILFLLFISGLETSFSKLKKMEKTSLFVAAGGIVTPFLLGTAAGFFLGFQIQVSIIVGLILIATSVGITVRTLMDIHALDTDVGATILGGAVIDDVLGIILLAFFLGTDPPLYVGIKIALFFLIFFYIGLLIIDKILDLGEKIQLPKAFLSISLAIFLLYTFFANSFGIAGLIGAFVAGLIIGHTLKYRKIIDDVQTIGYGLFIPLFFVWIGMNIWIYDYSLTFSSLATISLISAVIIIVAIVGKIIGCGLGAKLAGMKNRESLQVGIGMIPRMELALIIVSSAITHKILIGKIAYQLLTVTIILSIVTTLLTPILIKLVFKNL